MEIRYSEHAPGAGLADAVRCYWTIRGDSNGVASPIHNRVLPDNCIDVIFDLRPTTRRPAIVVGPMLTAEVFLQHPDADLLGVRFRPGAATEFLDVAAAELTPRHVVAADIWRDAQRLTEQLQESAGVERLRILEAHLLGRRRERRDAALARTATAVIERARGGLTVHALARALSVTERKLQRVFDTAVGIGPKQVLRVERFRAAASLIAVERSVSLARIAGTAGYADQAHLTREFAELAGVTPLAFRDEQRLVGFVQDPRRSPP